MTPWTPFVLLVPLLIGLSTPAEAQERTRNLLFVELGGNGLLYTFNYDRTFTQRMTARIGLGTWKEDKNPEVTGTDGREAALLLLMNYLIGCGANRLEVGAGPVYFYDEADGDHAGVTATLGYRYQPLSRGFSVRVGATPVWSDGEFWPWGGLSVGYGF